METNKQTKRTNKKIKGGDMISPFNYLGRFNDSSNQWSVVSPAPNQMVDCLIVGHGLLYVGKFAIFFFSLFLILNSHLGGRFPTAMITV